MRKHLCKLNEISHIFPRRLITVSSTPSSGQNVIQFFEIPQWEIICSLFHSQCITLDLATALFSFGFAWSMLQWLSGTMGAYSGLSSNLFWITEGDPHFALESDRSSTLVLLKGALLWTQPPPESLSGALTQGSHTFSSHISPVFWLFGVSVRSSRQSTSVSISSPGSIIQAELEAQQGCQPSVSCSTQLGWR